MGKADIAAIQTRVSRRVLRWFVRHGLLDARAPYPLRSTVASSMVVSLPVRKPISLQDWRSWGAPLAAIVREPGSRMMLGAALLYSLTSAMGKGAMQHMGPEQFGAFYFVLLGALFFHERGLAAHILAGGLMLGGACS